MGPLVDTVPVVDIGPVVVGITSIDTVGPILGNCIKEIQLVMGKLLVVRIFQQTFNSIKLFKWL